MTRPGQARGLRGSLRLAVLALASGVIGCSSAPGSAGLRDGPLGTASSPIIDGVASTAVQDFVVEVVHPVAGGAFVCSGSLVAPNLVLTARHCVSATPDEGFSCDSSGDGTDGGAVGADYDPSTVYVYAGLDAPDAATTPSATATRFFHDDATNICNHDLALLEIDPPLRGVPVATLDLDSQLGAGETVTAIGWGVTGNGLPPSVRQQRGGIPILAIGPATDAAGYGVAPDELEIGESICEGDSGGPLLDAAGAIVGVASRGGNGVNDASVMDPAATCVGANAVNIYTETAPFRDVILGAFAAVGAAPQLVSVPMGEACTTSGECVSGLCAAAEPDAGMTCTAACASSACPDGFRCAVGAGGSYCVPAPSSGCGVAASYERAGAQSPPWGSYLVLSGLLFTGAARRARYGAQRRR